MDKVLDVKGLKTNFYTEEGLVKAVDDLSFHINKGECVALVGESGCGKSASAMSILRLIPYPPGVIEDGEIFLKGEKPKGFILDDLLKDYCTSLLTLVIRKSFGLLIGQGLLLLKQNHL